MALTLTLTLSLIYFCIYLFSFRSKSSKFTIKVNDKGINCNMTNNTGLNDQILKNFSKLGFYLTIEQFFQVLFEYS